jgi:hypothetical protein
MSSRIRRDADGATTNPAAKRESILPFGLTTLEKVLVRGVSRTDIESLLGG